MIEVTPVTKTVIDWQIFLGESYDQLGRPILPAVIRQPVGDYRSWISALSNMRQQGRKFTFSAMEHLSFGFLVRSDLTDLMTLVTSTNLKCLVAESMGLIKTSIISGTLLQYYTAILFNLETEHENIEHRTFYNQLVLYFESIGLGEIWQRFSKKQRPDGTFLLAN